MTQPTRLSRACCSETELLSAVGRRHFTLLTDVAAQNVSFSVFFFFFFHAHDSRDCENVEQAAAGICNDFTPWRETWGFLSMSPRNKKHSLAISRILTFDWLALKCEEQLWQISNSLSVFITTLPKFNQSHLAWKFADLTLNDSQCVWWWLRWAFFRESCLEVGVFEIVSRGGVPL